MNRKVLVTGSEGLIGSELVKILRNEGYEVARLDIRAADRSSQGDVRDRLAVTRAIAGCIGVIHLAAVSRVLWGERDPVLCWETNVRGTENILMAAAELNQKPWVIFSSSREVYGQPHYLPVVEDAVLTPMNIYGRSKAAGEELVINARTTGLATAIARFSNVYGSIFDHYDRVVPAFACAATQGIALRVDGAEHTFDFTHLDDTVRGIISLVHALENGAHALPPIHFLTGNPTTLGDLASLAIELAGSESAIVQAPPRSYDVARFVGNPTRAKDLLDWTPRISIREGMNRLIRDYREQREIEIFEGSAA